MATGKECFETKYCSLYFIRIFDDKLTSFALKITFSLSFALFSCNINLSLYVFYRF